jgi:hypothetical protein
MRHLEQLRAAGRDVWSARPDVAWWSELDDAVLAILETGRVMTTGEIAHKLGVSESAAGSLLAMLALADKARIMNVAAVPPALRMKV